MARVVGVAGGALPRPSPIFSPLESPAPPRSPPPPSPPMPTLKQVDRGTAAATSARRRRTKRRRLTMNAIARAARTPRRRARRGQRDAAPLGEAAGRGLPPLARDIQDEKWRGAGGERTDKVNTLLQAVRQLEGRLSNALAAQQDVNKTGAARLASIFRNRERRAVRHAWLSLRATMYVAVDVAAYKAMEKERREAEAARIQRCATPRSTRSLWMLRDAAPRGRRGAEQREYCRGRAGPARRRRGTRTQQSRTGWRRHTKN